MPLKMSSAKWRPICLGFNVLIIKKHSRTWLLFWQMHAWRYFERCMHRIFFLKRVERWWFCYNRSSINSNNCSLAVFICQKLHVHTLTYMMSAITFGAPQTGLMTKFINMVQFEQSVPYILRYDGNKHQNNTRMSVQTARRVRIYIISFLYDITTLKMTIWIKNDDLLTLTTCLTR